MCTIVNHHPDNNSDYLQLQFVLYTEVSKHMTKQNGVNSNRCHATSKDICTASPRRWDNSIHGCHTNETE